MRTRKKVICFSLVALCFLAGCQKLRDPDPDYDYRMPDAEQEELPVESLEAEGMDETLIEQMTDLIIREDYKRVDAVLIIRNNKLVYEHYFHGYSEDILHNIFSAGKGITSILTGIAIDKGYIDSVNTPVLKLLPEYRELNNPDPRKNTITVEHLLNMSAGLDCEDWYKQTETQMQSSSDWVKFTLDLPMVNDPGTRGSYCTGCAVTLGRIIENKSGLSLQDFASKYLFDPLGIKDYKWHIMPDGKASGGGLLFLRPRDMVKIGLLMLNQGIYNGRRIVAEDWVRQSGQNKISLQAFDGYGYLWWKQKFSGNIDAYFADGNGGQHIFVVPSKQLTVVFTGGNKNTGVGLQNFQILNTYILPAVR